MNPVEIRLIGQPAEVQRVTELLQNIGLLHLALTRRDFPSDRTPGAILRYLEAVLPPEDPGQSAELTLVYHPGSGEHPPAIMVRGQLGAVVIAVDKIPLLCGNLMGLYALYGGESPETVDHIMSVMETKKE